jgi:hypothetical protein
MSRLNGYTLPLGPNDPSNPAEGGAPELRKVVSSTVAGVTSSSTSTSTILYNLFVPANTFVINEVLDLRAMGVITRPLATACTLRFYWGTTASTITGAILLGTCTYAAGSTVVGEKPLPFHRRLGIRNTTTQTIVLDTVRSTSTDIRVDTNNESHMTGGIDLVAVNWTTDGYFIVQGNTTTTADVLQVKWMKINN